MDRARGAESRLRNITFYLLEEDSTREGVGGEPASRRGKEGKEEKFNMWKGGQRCIEAVNMPTAFTEL